MTFVDIFIFHIYFFNLNRLILDIPGNGILFIHLRDMKYSTRER